MYNVFSFIHTVPPHDIISLLFSVFLLNSENQTTAVTNCLYSLVRADAEQSVSWDFFYLTAKVALLHSHIEEGAELVSQPDLSTD